MKKVLFMSILACAFGVFTSCSSDDDVANANETTTGGETTETSFGEVQVKVANVSSRAASSLLPTKVTNVTATFVSPIGETGYFVVTYHGRNGNDAGMVQIVDKKGTVKSELTTLDARVNTAAYDANSNAVYIGLDKSNSKLNKTETTELATGCHCAVAKVTLNDNSEFPNISVISADKIFGLNGVSVNCITVKDGGGLVYIATSTGTVDFGGTGSKTYYGGYWKIATTKSENIESATTEEVSSNGEPYAAYWYSLSDNYRVKVRRASAHSADCSATLFEGETEKARAKYTSTNADDDDSNNQYGRTSAAYLNIKGNYYLFTCGDNLTAWTLSDGTFTNMNDGSMKKTDSKGNVHEDDCVSGSYTTAVATDGTYVYACTGSRVSKYYLRTYSLGDNKGKTRFELKGKYDAPDTWAKTQENTTASANHLYVKGDKVYVAFGYQGFVVLDAETDFTLDSSK